MLSKTGIGLFTQIDILPVVGVGNWFELILTILFF